MPSAIYERQVILMTQADSALLGLARKGDVQAITTLINLRTQPQGITAKVAIKGDCLQLLLETQEDPEQQALTSLARSFLISLKISGIHRTKLYGRRKGDEFPAWNTELETVEQTSSQPTPVSSRPVSATPKSTSTPAKPTSKFGGSFQLSSSLPKTSEQQKISKSKAYEYGIAGAILGLIISFPSVWAALQMLQLQGGYDFATGYVIGIGVVVFFGYLSGFGQGLTQFEVNCPSCKHKFILSASGGSCPACSAGLYLDEQGDCQIRS